MTGRKLIDLTTATVRWAGVAIVLACSARPASAQSDTLASRLRPARLFSDGLVLQRGLPVPVWGWAPARTPVSVSLDGQTRTTTADATGEWRVTFPAMKAGGPYEMTIAGGSTRLDVHDILVGDVWVASGQSNMEWPVESSDNAAAEIASASDAKIREFAIPHSYSEKPEAEVIGGSWAHANPQHVGHFSGVAYFFARDLRKSIDVPIGIIHTSWGGANIETWMSRQALGMSDTAWRAAMEKDRAHNDSMRMALRARIGDLPTTDAGLVNGQAVWADPMLADDSWAAIRTPALWETAGYDGMDGIAWYRTSFTLTEDEARQPARLSLGPIDDSDITWVNGVEVGRTTQRYADPRLYTIPASALRAGKNVIAVRVDDTGGGGGIYGSPASLYVDVGGVRRPLAGDWRFRVGLVSFQPDGQRINKIPTILYNRMIHPLLGFPIKGVIWYQGESNANTVAQATDYRPLFQKLITSWRREWRGSNPEFPFLWVQLPNYGKVDSVPPTASGWATVRESQAAALSLSNTGQVVAIDIGQAEELHPRNKQDVAARLALKAREVAYGQRIVSSGPSYLRHSVTGGRVTIELANVGGGLVSRSGGGAIRGFAIAGDDRRFVWADAKVEGNRVIVWSDRVPKPVAVRYLWSDSPPAPALYNTQALPVAPFRTDRWSGSVATSDPRFDWFEYRGDDSVYKLNRAGPNDYYNPIIAGFYPDPTIIRAGNDYYLATSSFAYFPGVPIFHSRDLVNWTQIGHILDRPSQLNLDSAGVSRGIFAPALSYHDGTFYMITTLVDRGGNFYVTAKNPAGPWSDPVWLSEIDGIDPSFFFDDDGRAYILNNGPPVGEPLYSGHRAIWMQQYDLAARKLVGPRTMIVNGGVDLSKKPIWIEAPHIFRRNGTYYLICAEGGTADQHSEVVFRSDSVMGPYVPYTGNPILTQRHLDPARSFPVETTGHADFVETPNGEWWAVFLGTRNYGRDLWNIGRETFLLPVTWEAGWPTMLKGRATVPYVRPGPDLPRQAKATVPHSGNFTVRDEFDGATLAPYWEMLRTPREQWYDVTSEPGSLKIRARPEELSGQGQPSFLGRRQQHGTATATVAMRYMPGKSGDRAGIVAFHNDSHYYFLGVVQDGAKPVLELRRRAWRGEAGDSLVASAPIALSPTKPLYLRIRARVDKYDFLYATSPNVWKTLLAGADGTILSTKVAGGFVGTMFGMYAYTASR